MYDVVACHCYTRITAGHRSLWFTHPPPQSARPSRLLTGEAFEAVPLSLHGNAHASSATAGSCGKVRGASSLLECIYIYTVFLSHLSLSLCIYYVISYDIYIYIYILDFNIF